MQGPKQEDVSLSSADASCHCARKECCEIAVLKACIRAQKPFCAIDLLLKQAKTGNSSACVFLQESLANKDERVHSLLVESAKQGSDMAFRFLYEHYWPPLFAYIAQVIGGSHHNIACELTQEAFFKAWKELPKTNGETARKFKAWLYTIASNLTRDYFRQSGQSQSFVGSLEQEGIERVDGIARNRSQRLYVEGPEDIVCETDFVSKALGQVKPRYREALWLEAYSNGSQAEKARQLGIHEGTFSGYVHHGREELKAAYRRLAEALEIQEKGREAHE